MLHLIKGLGAGGAERLLVSLADARSAEVAFDVGYFLPHKAQLAPELEAVGATVHLLGGRKGTADPRWPSRLVSLVKRTRPDVVHLHSPALGSGARIVLRALRQRPVIVSTDHNVWPSYGWITRFANGVTFRLADAQLAVSDEVRGSVWAWEREPVEVVVQGIPVRALSDRRTERSAARSRLGVGPDDVVVATVANFREKKDYPTLLAAARSCADHPNVSFIAIGQGPLQGEMVELHERLGLTDRFRFLGYQADPSALVVGADIFTLTSRHEGLPISLLEAMALGVAPVVSAVGGIPQVILDGVHGALISPGDPTAFAQAFLRLADAPAERARLGAAAALRAADFDIARTQHELEGTYRRLLAVRAG